MHGNHRQDPTPSPGGNESISAVAHSLNLSRNTVKKYLKTTDAPQYQRQPRHPRLGAFIETLTQWLERDSHLPKAQRRTARRLLECLQAEGYAGAYDSIQRHVKARKASKPGTLTPKQAFVPLLFAPGEVCQFDWSYEQVVLGGITQTIKLAHFRLAYSRQPFVIAYPRETQEMVLDAHVQVFAFFGGTPRKMIYDNLKTVVDAIFTGKSRRFNSRHLALANHYLFEPVACTPASGWEKGQVENQVEGWQGFTKNSRCNRTVIRTM
ncbi:IS21 family transposase [Chromobacterium piscinae]|nr:IS21 family transposase [Chromobacterium piscinae]MCD5327526.1 IS21 family transposase [Chromobacterium piscinae]